jgi:hypothetical protein
MLVVTAATESEINRQGYRVFNAAIILNKNNSKQNDVLSEVKKLIGQINDTKSGNSWTISFTEHQLITLPSTPKKTLDSYLNFSKSINLTIDIAIFMEISRETVLLSQVLQEMHIPTIGLQQRNIGGLSSVSH